MENGDILGRPTGLSSFEAAAFAAAALFRFDMSGIVLFLDRLRCIGESKTTGRKETGSGKDFLWGGKPDAAGLRNNKMQTRRTVDVGGVLYRRELVACSSFGWF
jgi:hypothetical protein